MYTAESYGLLSELGRAELRQELSKARRTLEYFQALDNQPLEPGDKPVDIQFMLRGIQNSEAYIIEIERRLGVYEEWINTMLMKHRFKAIQSRGIQPSALCQAENVETSSQILGVKRFRKFNIRGVS